MTAAAEQAPIDVNKIRLSVLDANQSMAYWDFIVPHLAPVFEYSAGRVGLEDTRKLVEEGMAEVMLIWLPEDGTIFSVMVIEARVYPNRRVMNIGLCAGRDLNLWAERMWPAIQEVARQKGFNQIEVMGRRGWGHFIPGAKEIATFYAMDLDTDEVSDG